MHSNLINTRLVLASAALAVLGALTATAPVSAASRVLALQDDTFVDRCVSRVGILQTSGADMVCTLEATAVACQFQQNTARCSWAGGIYNRAALALLGWPDSTASYDTAGDGILTGNGGNGGGIDLPDLPLDNGNGGGGGIELPDLPLDNGNGGGGGIDLPDLPLNNT